jgi:hypothetical protein
MELTTPAVIDWTFSGVGLNGYGLGSLSSNTVVAPGLDNPIIITFSPSGRVDRVFMNGVSETPLGTLYLLVGRVDQVGPLGGQDIAETPQDLQDAKTNLQDSRSLWVSIGHRSGRINTSPNQGSPLITNVADARQFAARAQSMGAR